MNNLFSIKSRKTNNDIKAYYNDCSSECSATCSSGCVVTCANNCDVTCRDTCKTTCQTFCKRVAVL